MAYFDCTIGSAGEFSIPLVVTCTANFAGQIITCSDGITTLTQICPSSSPYTVEFKIPNAGIWTISSGTNSTSVTIPSSAELHDIPNGSTITPTDSIQIWLHCANIWDKAYTTISQVLADISTLQALIASNNAVDYMARSTTWASNVTANSSAMTYIGLNNYCANKLLANSTWRTAICNSTYFDSVFTTKVPTMTSNTTPSGTVFSSTPYNSDYAGYKAFDNNMSSSFAVSSTSGEFHVGYEFPQSVKVYIAVITHNAGSSLTRITSEKFQSYNGSTWVDETSGFSPISGENKKILTNPISATKHRLVFSQTSQGFIPEVQFYGRA